MLSILMYRNGVCDCGAANAADAIAQSYSSRLRRTIVHPPQPSQITYSTYMHTMSYLYCSSSYLKLVTVMNPSISRTPKFNENFGGFLELSPLTLPLTLLLAVVVMVVVVVVVLSWLAFMRTVMARQRRDRSPASQQLR